VVWILHTCRVKNDPHSKYAVKIDKYMHNPCPKRFSLHPQGYFQCDPILSSYIPSLTNCDIDHQTIPRPANAWAFAHAINNSHSYHVSLQCPFDYCLYLTHRNSTCPLAACSCGDKLWAIKSWLYNFQKMTSLKKFFTAIEVPLKIARKAEFF